MDRSDTKPSILASIWPSQLQISCRLIRDSGCNPITHNLPSPNPPPQLPLRHGSQELSPMSPLHANWYLTPLSQRTASRLTYISYGLHSTFCSRWAIERGGAKDDYTVMAPGRSLGGSLFINSKQVCSERVSKASQLLTVNSLYGVNKAGTGINSSSKTGVLTSWLWNPWSTLPSQSWECPAVVNLVL